MQDKIITTLLLGDVYGESGCRAVFLKLRDLVDKTRADYVVANGENANEGFGLSVANMNLLFSSGVNVITSGNHIWQSEEIIPYLDSEKNLLRPANYSSMVPGHGFTVTKEIGVVNLIGRQMLVPAEDPFKVATDMVRRIRQQTKTIFVDFHAESTEEKEALAYYLDGTVTAVVGTHTHVQTADERILDGGTAYITDIGMSGPEDSVIGGDAAVSVRRQKTQMPIKAQPSKNPGYLSGVIVKSDASTGKAVSIERFTV